jgi:putative hydrolase of the HAD superfamily
VNNGLLIWDFDSTLAYRPGQWTGTLLEVLDTERPGHGVTADQIRPFLQAGFPWHTPERIRDAKVHPDEWWSALDAIFLKAYREAARMEEGEARFLCSRVRQTYVNPVCWVLYDDVIPCLTALSEDGWRHIILSNHVPELPHIMASLEISSYFEAIFNSAETGVEKPNPRAFHNVLATTGEVEEVWVIGDNVAADVEGAKSAGLRPVLVRKPHPDADEYCETLHDLTAFLRRTHDLGLP